MMPIQRQNEGYGVFDDGNMRFAKDYETRDLPEGLVNALSRGVGITAGLNDPRGMSRLADAYPAPGDHFDPHGPYGSGIDNYARPSEPEGYEDSQYGDPGYGEEPGAEHFPPQGDAPEQPLDHFIEQHQSEAHHFPPEEPVHFARHADYDEQFRNHQSFSEARSGGPASSKTALATPPADPMTGWVGHGYVPGHRVGLPWRAQTIPGTVTHLDGQQVGIRWDDGQHSTEEPADLRPL